MYDVGNKEKQMENGVSLFKYWILEDTVELSVRIDWDEFGEPMIEEILIKDLDVTEEILSYGLRDKLIEWAIDHDCFLADSEVLRSSKD